VAFFDPRKIQALIGVGGPVRSGKTVFCFETPRVLMSRVARRNGDDKSGAPTNADDQMAPIAVAIAGHASGKGNALCDLAAGFVIGLLAAGAAARLVLRPQTIGMTGDRRSRNIWSSIRTRPSRSGNLQMIEALKLNVVAKQVGAALTPANVSLRGLRFESADLLSCERAPLAEVAYVDAHSSPLLFCVIANGGADTPNRSEKRGDLALSS
jgi:hypothetical protein